jgi:hypothetical protein
MAMPSWGVTKLELVYFDAGGGHRAAARALESAIREQRRPWDCHLLNLQEVLDPIDICRRLVGVRGQDIYNGLLRRGWTAGSAGMIRLMHYYIQRTHSSQVALLEAHWKQSRPDMVVSLIPHFNRAIEESLARVCPGAPMVTVLTDLADYPPAFWIQSPNQHVVCGTPLAVLQARTMGCPNDRIWETSGMVLDPRFYEPSAFDRDAQRRRMGLDPNLPTALVSFGGHGSAVMMDIARRLSQAARPVQGIMLCGHNRSLAQRLWTADLDMRMLVIEHTVAVPYYMSLADFFIGKPGPGSVSEALAMGLPVIVERNVRTLAQERYNAQWVMERGVGVVVKSFRDIVPAVEQITEPGRLARLQGTIARIRNRAVFEVPAILESILRRSADVRDAAALPTFLADNVSYDRYADGMTV